MTKLEFMRALQIPIQWEEWGMYPDELLVSQIARFEPIHAEAPEHDRNGMFHWWLRRNPSKEQLVNLARLSLLDPDQHMGRDVRSYICRASNFDSEVDRACRPEA